MDHNQIEPYKREVEEQAGKEGRQKTTVKLFLQVSDFLMCVSVETMETLVVAIIFKCFALGARFCVLALSSCLRRRAVGEGNMVGQECSHGVRCASRSLNQEPCPRWVSILQCLGLSLSAGLLFSLFVLEGVLHLPAVMARPTGLALSL